MKRILSVAIAVLMMLVCFISAFALESPENPGAEYKVSISATKGGTFSYTLDNGTYTVVAVPADDHRFTGWNMTGEFDVVDGDDSSEKIVFIPKSDMNVLVCFDGNTDVNVTPWDGKDSPKTADMVVPAVVVACTALLGIGYCVNRLKKK